MLMMGEVSVLMREESTFVHRCYVMHIFQNMACFFSFLSVLILSLFVHKESDLFIDI